MGLDFIPMGLATGVAGSNFATQVVQAIAGLGNFVMPAGVYYVYTVGADVRLQVQDASLTFQNVSAVAIGGLVASDGTNVRYNNANAAAQNITYIKIG